MIGWTPFFSQLSSLSLLSITVRLLLTTVFAGTLGFERERHNQAAGFRTYIIVADAAALVMMTNLYIGDVFGSTDLVRMSASVITGLGFLGAGTILVTKSHEIKGLTTAAGLWAVAIIGTAFGAGFYAGGTVCYAFILLAMNVLRLVDVRIQSRQKTATVYFELRSKLSIRAARPPRAGKRTAHSRSWAVRRFRLRRQPRVRHVHPLGGGPHVARRYPSGTQRRRGRHLPHQDLTTAAWDAEAFASASCFSAVPTGRFPLASRTAIPYNGEKKRQGRRRAMVTDDILYRRYLGGDEDSLSALMERHGDKLTLYLDGCLHDLHESEDLMIEAFRLPDRQTAPASATAAFEHISTDPRGTWRCGCFQKARTALLLARYADGGAGGAGAVEEAVESAERAHPARVHGGAARRLPRGAVPRLLRGLEPRGDRRRHGQAGKSRSQTSSTVEKNALRKRLEQEGITDAYNG